MSQQLDSNSNPSSNTRKRLKSKESAASSVRNYDSQSADPTVYPTSSSQLRPQTGQGSGRSCLSKLALTCLTFICSLYIVIPLLRVLCPSLVVRVVFLHDLQIPSTPYEEPAAFGLNGTRQFFVNVEEGVQLGVWHVLPKTLVKETSPDDDYYEKSLSAGMPIFLYLHGNAYSRAAGHRVELYKILQGQNYHVIAVDYRGFGDSSGSPTEDGVVVDTKFMYKWIQDRSKHSPVFVFGHSLGTSIGTRAVAELCHEGAPPVGLFLESPFTSLMEVSNHHPIGRVLRFLYPYAGDFFLDAVHEQNVFFATDEHINKVNIPILIMHAEDDQIVPYHMGVKLYEVAKLNKKRHVEFIRYDGSLGYRHIDIIKDPDLGNKIRKFVDFALG